MKKSQPASPGSADDALAPLVKKFRKELNSGTGALVVLTVMAKAREPLYGYQIAKQLEDSGFEKQGSLYPVLRNLDAKGLLSSYVEPSDSGPPRRYFHISPLGREVLREWLAIWRQTQSFVSRTIGDLNV